MPARWNLATMPGVEFGYLLAASRNFGSAAWSFSCSVVNVPACGSGAGLPGAGAASGTTGAS